MPNMTKNKVQPSPIGDDLDLEEKTVVPGEIEEEETVEVSDEDEELLDADEVDPFHDKWEE
jgi:hypothetical protein